MNNYQDFFAALQQAKTRQEPLIEACLTDTDGSSYRKSGARMLIKADGDMVGLVTGGCLEGDLALLAPELIAEQQHRVLNYDMRTQDPQQCVFGPGCNGRVRVRLSLLQPENDYGVLGLVQHYFPEEVQVLSAIDDSGDFALRCQDAVHYQGALPENFELLLANGRSHPQVVHLAGRDYLLETINPARMLTILSATSDAQLLATLAAQMGFYVQLLDHRKGYVEAAVAQGLRARDLNDAEFPIASSDAVVIMSHDFDRDAESLRLALDSQATYIGLLGPVDRRNRLLAKADLALPQFATRLFSPAGLDIGADTSDQISLSILAEMLATLNRSSAEQLKDKTGGIHD